MPSIVEEVKSQPLLAIAAAAGVGGVILLLVNSKKSKTPDTIGSQALYYPGGSQGVGTYSPPVPPVPNPNTDPPPRPTPWQCPTGSHWDWTLFTCVPNVPNPNPGGDPPVPVPIPHGCRDANGNDRPCPDPGPNPGPIVQCQAGWYWNGTTCVRDGYTDEVTVPVLVPMGAGLDGLFTGGRGGGEPSASTSPIAYPRIYNNLMAMQALRGYR